MENPDGTEQGTGHSRGSVPSTGGSDGSTRTVGTLLPLIPPGTAFWAGSPPLGGPAGPPRNPASSTGQDHSSQGPQCPLLELATTASGKGALPASGRRSHPLCQTDPANHSCPKQYFSTPHTKQVPKQDFWIVGDELQCHSQNCWPWTSEQASGIQSQDYSWSAKSNLQVPSPNLWIPEQDTRTCEWNSWALCWNLTSDPGSLRHLARSFQQRLPGIQPPGWTSSFSKPCS
ncbi:thrombopoietin isoform X10 [Mus musculus]|uniref:thrombopoietin isoform X10 n=1 Tax=Mus musculus TaxID=10090 RepID=UPI0005ABA3A7|nr:thrombopoietin isoform X10 [Mus musculus]|eukprot:XP_017172423.1 PREDICTED: thrombopoietin isoform X10 [Mus musculus]